jgi:hypothetical protein
MNPAKGFDGQRMTLQSAETANYLLTDAATIFVAKQDKKTAGEPRNAIHRPSRNQR